MFVEWWKETSSHFSKKRKESSLSCSCLLEPLSNHNSASLLAEPPITQSSPCASWLLLSTWPRPNLALAMPGYFLITLSTACCSFPIPLATHPTGFAIPAFCLTAFSYLIFKLQVDPSFSSNVLFSLFILAIFCFPTLQLSTLWGFEPQPCSRSSLKGSVLIETAS
jgi:hypothetical protein